MCYLLKDPRFHFYLLSPAIKWLIVDTGQISSQRMQAMSQGVFTAIVLKLLIKPGGCGQIATHAPQLMHAFQPIENNTALSFFNAYNFLYSDCGLK